MELQRQVAAHQLERLLAEDLASPAMHGWRREVFGEKALELVRGDLALKFHKRRIVVFETG